MANHQPKPGDRVRVVRTKPNGTTHFTKTGVIRQVNSTGYLFDDDAYGPRSLAGSDLVAQTMRGWTQTITVIGA